MEHDLEFDTMAATVMAKLVSQMIARGIGSVIGQVTKQETAESAIETAIALLAEDPTSAPYRDLVASLDLGKHPDLIKSIPTSPTEGQLLIGLPGVVHRIFRDQLKDTKRASEASAASDAFLSRLMETLSCTGPAPELALLHLLGWPCLLERQVFPQIGGRWTGTLTRKRSGELLAGEEASIIAEFRAGRDHLVMTFQGTSQTANTLSHADAFKVYLTADGFELRSLYTVRYFEAPGRPLNDSREHHGAQIILWRPENPDIMTGRYYSEGGSAGSFELTRARLK